MGTRHCLQVPTKYRMPRQREGEPGTFHYQKPSPKLIYLASQPAKGRVLFLSFKSFTSFQSSTALFLLPALPIFGARLSIVWSFPFLDLLFCFFFGLSKHLGGYSFFNTEEKKLP